MKTYTQLFTILCWLVWPMCAWATSVTLGETLGDVPARAWFAVFVLSAVSGIMALLQQLSQAMKLAQQMNAESDPESKAALAMELAKVELPSGWRLFVTWHMAGALLMGAIAFLFMEASDINDFIESVGIALSAYGGARSVDRLSSGFFRRVMSAVQQKPGDENV